MQAQTSSLLPPKDNKFGEDIKPYFMLDEKYLNVNTGSYGIIPRYVYEAKKQYSQQIEKNPNYHYKYEHPKLMKNRTELVANFMNCEPENVGFNLNASEGLNISLRGIKYQKGDVVITCDCCYSAVKQMIGTLVNLFGVEYVQIPTDKSMLNDDKKFLNALNETLEKYKGKVKVAVIDHISSAPSALFDIKKVIQLFRDNNIPLIIDGAHTFGRIKIDIQDESLENFQ